MNNPHPAGADLTLEQRLEALAGDITGRTTPRQAVAMLRRLGPSPRTLILTADEKRRLDDPWAMPPTPGILAFVHPGPVLDCAAILVDGTRVDGPIIDLNHIDLNIQTIQAIIDGDPLALPMDQSVHAVEGGLTARVDADGPLIELSITDDDHREPAWLGLTADDARRLSLLLLTAARLADA